MIKGRLPAVLQATFAAYEQEPVHPTKPKMKAAKIWPGKASLPVHICIDAVQASNLACQ